MPIVVVIVILAVILAILCYLGCFKRISPEERAKREGLAETGFGQTNENEKMLNTDNNN